jgi:hypothetical protein
MRLTSRRQSKCDRLEMLAPSQRLRIIVGGLVGQFPLGGVAWDYFHYVLGLHELGHEVYYEENTDTWLYDPAKQEPTGDGTFAASFIDSFFARYCPELRSRWHFNLLRKESFGLTREQFDEVAASADIFLNISGACVLPEKLNPRCKTVFVDTDPGFNQIRIYNLQQKEGDKCEHYHWVASHDVFLTYAENVHSPDFDLPQLDLRWIATRPVVNLPLWDWCRRVKPKDEAFTTVMTLDFSATFKGLDFEGRKYYDKRTEFERFIDLPLHTRAILRPAIGRHTGLEHVLKKGWQVTPAHLVSDTPERYQEFIAGSYGEWSIAKNVYTEANTGWFSCRTCCYLAAGRPAVVQDTSWSRYIPSGEGLFAFRTLEEVAAALDAVKSDYPKHQQAAYGIAHDFFSPSATLGPALESIMNS